MMEDSLGTGFSWLRTALAELQRNDLRRFPSEREGPQDRLVVLDGQPCLNFGANDYLGLAADPRLAAAAIDALSEYGWGSAASPLVSGRSTPQARLEAALADFEECEAALIFPSGYAANVGTITALAGRGDHLFSDAKNHASIVDGCRLSGGIVHVFPHADVGSLAQMLKQVESQSGRRLIITDALFSMDGDLANLPELVSIADRFDAMVLVDEAHATGVFGEQGRGVSEHFSLALKRVVRVGTLSKAIGSVGGFVVGTKELIAWIANRARPYIFSTALPAACCAAALAALAIVRDEPHRRHDLLRHADWLRRSLREADYDICMSDSQIIPIRIGEPSETHRYATTVRSQGFYIPGIRPPSVPVGESLLRISLGYGHTQEDIEALLAAVKTSLPAA